MILMSLLTLITALTWQTFAQEPRTGACAALLSPVIKAETDIETENSNSVLLESFGAIADLYNIKQSPVPGVFPVILSNQNSSQNTSQNSSQNTVLIDKKMPLKWVTKDRSVIDLSPFYILHAVIVKALTQHLQISQDDALQFSWRAQKHAIRAANLNWSEYKDFMAEKAQIDISLEKSKFSSAIEHLLKKVQVSKEYDIPYLAGYSRNSAREVYIDSGVLPLYRLQDGRTVDIIPFLILHEAIEKSLMLELPFKEKQYERTHQWAQRIEQEAVEASEILWSEYQGQLIKDEFHRIDNMRIRKTPLDLDYTPYEAYSEPEDADLIRRMQRVAELPDLRQLKVGASINIPGLALVAQPLPHVYFLKYKKNHEMAKTFMRFQEHYESPKFRGKIFSRSEFKKWYRWRKGMFDYYEFWDGFNVPGDTLNTFRTYNFPYLTAEERRLLNLFKNLDENNFYLIAAVDNPATTIANHELAHALYFTNSDYRNEINAVLARVDSKKLEKFIGKKMGDYHDAVLHDEAHAWLMNDHEDLRAMKFDLIPYQQAIVQLNKIFQKYMANAQANNQNDLRDLHDSAGEK